MKTKTATLKSIKTVPASIRPKLRGKAAKLAALQRSAAAKRHWHRKRSRKLAHLHFVALALGILLVASGGGILAAMADNLIPPPGADIDIAAYERAAAANRPPSVASPDQVGKASWYALGLRAPDALTCASTTFPRGTYLEVTDLRNGRKVTCLVDDYGPAKSTGRVIDLSRGSYSQLEGLGSGTLPAEIRVKH
jgi:rare lipoprotein A (peptidoglycan hydrolase)